MSRESLILIIYIGISGLGETDALEYIDRIKKDTMDIEKKDVTFFYVPDFESSVIRIDCINPILLTADLYEKAKIKLEEINTKLEQLINNIK